MLLIQPKKGSPGKWEIAWMWVPMFLSMNSDLVGFVDEKMTEEFKGKDLSDSTLQSQMHQAVIRLITEKNPVQGLEAYLAGISAVVVPEEFPEEITKS